MRGRRGHCLPCPGSIYHFSTWVAGTRQDVVVKLRRAGGNELAEIIAKEAQDIPGARRLASVLGTTQENIVEALRAVHLELREVREDTAQELEGPRTSLRKDKTGKKSQREMRPRRPYRTSSWRSART
jgi:hypothetical protein